MTFTRIEQEAIVLNAAWAMIDDMVNFAIFVPLGSKIEDTNLMPQTADTLRLFHVLLGDFLSPLIRKGRGGLPFDLPQPPSGARPSDLTFLFYVRQVFEQPMLNPDSSALRQPSEAFADWLEQDSFVEEVWLPSIEVQADLTIRRIVWLKICADIGKHSFARLEPNVGKLVSILAQHGKEIDEGMGYAALPDFWDWFHTHLFGYHASTVAEFLNNIRWGLYAYLRPEFERAYRVTERVSDLDMYVYDYPPGITAPIARTMYWELMNRVRSRPYFPPFTVTQSLKNRY
jgi:hypothetical protein